MTAPGYPPGYYGRAEQLAAEARRYLGQEDGKGTAAVLAAVAQVHATLAVAEAIEAALASRRRPEIPRPGSFRPWCLSPGSLASARCPDSSPAMRSKGSQGACTGALSRAARHPVLLQARP